MWRVTWRVSPTHLGGEVRAERLRSEDRKAIARKAAEARWTKAEKEIVKIERQIIKVESWFFVKLNIQNNCEQNLPPCAIVPVICRKVETPTPLTR